MFSFSLNTELSKQIFFFSVVFLTITSICFVETKSLNKSFERYRRSLEEYESITDPNLLSKQYSLVNQFGGVDILGDIRQFKNGKVDTRDFGQNIHFNYKDNIRPGEKQRAINELFKQGQKIATRLFQTLLQEWLND